MATTHRIFEDFYEDSFVLMALHSGLEDYSLAYAINKSLKSKLKRSNVDLDISQNISFPIFEWKDTVNDRYWTLITNTSINEENLGIEDLFQDETSSTRHYLVPEYREVDFFLKIEQDDVDDKGTVLRSLLSIPKVITAYTVDANGLKSKKNLIF